MTRCQAARVSSPHSCSHSSDCAHRSTALPARRSERKWQLGNMFRCVLKMCFVVRAHVPWGYTALRSRSCTKRIQNCLRRRQPKLDQGIPWKAGTFLTPLFFTGSSSPQLRSAVQAFITQIVAYFPIVRVCMQTEKPTNPLKRICTVSESKLKWSLRKQRALLQAREKGLWCFSIPERVDRVPVPRHGTRGRQIRLHPALSVTQGKGLAFPLCEPCHGQHDERKKSSTTPLAMDSRRMVVPATSRLRFSKRRPCLDQTSGIKQTRHVLNHLHGYDFCTFKQSLTSLLQVQ